MASTDLMEHARILAEDKTLHPAAPILLASAALEVALRCAVEELGLDIAERPSLSAHARRLRAEGVLSLKDVKDVEQMAGLPQRCSTRRFDELSPERSGLLEQQVNLFLRRLGALLSHRATESASLRRGLSAPTDLKVAGGSPCVRQGSVGTR